MNKPRSLVLIGLFGALLGIFSQLMLPSPAGIPLTLQTFAVALCGFLLGWKRGLAALCVWLTLGAVGVPVFSGFRGGAEVLFGPAGGFLIGFLWLVFFCGLILSGKPWASLIFSFVGLLLCYVTGATWGCFVAHLPVETVILSVCLPYFLKDVLCLLGAYFCARGIGRILFFEK